MKHDLAYYGGLLPFARHGFRVVLNRVWSRVLRRGLAGGGRDFNADFTTRILGGRRVRIGDGFYAGRGLKLIVTAVAGVTPVIRIGDNVGVNEFVTLVAHDRITIGDNVLIGSRAYLGNINHGCYRGAAQSDPDSLPNDRPFSSSGPLAIGANVWLGEGVLIPGGISIGAGSIIGAGSVVTKDVPAHVIAVGNPARVVKQFDAGTRTWLPVAAARVSSSPLLAVSANAR